MRENAQVANVEAQEMVYCITYIIVNEQQLCVTEIEHKNASYAKFSSLHGFHYVQGSS